MAIPDEIREALEELLPLTEGLRDEEDQRRYKRVRAWLDSQPDFKPAATQAEIQERCSAREQGLME